MQFPAREARKDQGDDDPFKSDDNSFGIDADYSEATSTVENEEENTHLNEESDIVLERS